MSWSAQTRRVLKGNAATVIDAAMSSPARLTKEQDEQFTLAKNVAKVIAASDAIAGPAVLVTMAGHANEGGTPKSGGSPDSLTVTVSQAEAADDEVTPQ